MNTQNPPNAQGGAGRGGGPAPRGRGAGLNRGRGNGRVTPSVTRSKVGPNRLLEADWVGDAALKVQSFVIWLAAGQTGHQQWTFHRPIGQTNLGEGVWVATPTRDIPFLLARKGNEETAAWERQSQLAKKQAVLASRTGRALTEGENPVEIWVTPGAPAIQPTIRTCMAAARAAGQPDANWLQFAAQPVQADEQAYKNAVRNAPIPAAWLRDHPRPRFETRGGPLGDQEQTPVEYLSGLSLQGAQDKVLNVLLGRTLTGPTPVPPPSEEGEERTSQTEEDAEQGDQN